MMEKDCRTLGEKVSDSVARFGGSWNFILSGFAIILAWGIINNIYFLPHWDEYPFILFSHSSFSSAIYSNGTEKS
jgi:uncharacterized membrane protein